MICRECETVAHCTAHGCIPKVDRTIDMAREAGLYLVREIPPYYGASINSLKAFEALVRADEREACAKFFDLNDTNLFWGSQAARYIRARGETK